MSTLGKDIARGLGRAFVIRMIAAAIGLPLGCLLVGAILLVVNTFYDRPWIIVVITGGLLTLVFGGSFLFVLVSVLRRKAQLDAIFVPHGLAGDAYQTFFRQYHGELAGHEVSVFFFRGPFLEIVIPTQLRTRLGVTSNVHSDTRTFAGIAGQTPLVLDDPSLAGLQIFAADGAWARSVLARAGVAEALGRLVALRGSFTRQQVLLSPGQLKLICSGSRRLFGIDLTTEQVEAWLTDLITVLRAVEGAEGPVETLEPTSLERLARESRGRSKYLALWVGLGTLAFFAVLAVVIFAVVFALSGAGII